MLVSMLVSRFHHDKKSKRKNTLAAQFNAGQDHAGFKLLLNFD
jgi:hypothetical protein